MLKIEEIRPMAKRLELCRHSPHDRHYEAVFEIGVDRAETLEAEHYSSHMRSRIRRSATGCKLLSARVCAWRMRFFTVSALSRKKYGIPSGRSTGSVTLPPWVCHGSRSPKVPR